MTEQLLKLPEKPGTVIAIGDWWLVRLQPYDGAPSAWELLPMPTRQATEHARRNGVKAQCVYGDDWVLAEVEQEGGYVIISDPRDQPSGVQYFRPDEKGEDIGPQPPVWDGTGTPPIGARVMLRNDWTSAGGEVVGDAYEIAVQGVTDVIVPVLWDGMTAPMRAAVPSLAPEEQP